MSITTFAELKTAITNWTHRSDLTDRLPEFIAMAEAYMNRELQTREMESATSTTLSAATASLPPDWHGYRNVWVILAGARHHLKYKPPHEMSRLNDSGVGVPNFFTIEDGNLRVEPPPDGDYELGYVYYQKIPALTDSNTTNWLLTDHPDLYLNASLAEAYSYTHDARNEAKHRNMAFKLIGQVKRHDKQERWSGAPMAVAPN